jgi:hypothetical protein
MEAEEAARQILAQIEANYKPTHDYVAVNPQSFRHLDLAFYDHTTQLLRSQGYKHLCDVEDRTLAASPGNVLFPVMIRSLVSSDGSVMASLYHPRIKPLWLRALLWLTGKRLGTVIDMETEFSDGSFVTTSNAMSASAMTSPPLIKAEFLPIKSTVEEIGPRHTARVEEHLRGNPAIRTKTISNHDQLVASQNRMNAIKSAFRGEIGGITKEELERILAGRHTELVSEIHAAVVAENRNTKA